VRSESTSRLRDGGTNTRATRGAGATTVVSSLFGTLVDVAFTASAAVVGSRVRDFNVNDFGLLHTP
jgi:hypothetical protein